jgi:mycoredoxin
VDGNGVVVYYQPGCPFAAKLRTKLRLSRVPHTSVNFHETEAAKDQVRRVNDGNEVSPTVRVGDQWLTNPTVRQIRRALAK